MQVNGAGYIEKDKPHPRAQDYRFLRDAGVEHISKLGSKIWTDYNTHDPGITIHEMLCYTLTDLAYRTSYPVEDILAEDTGTDVKGALFSAREIMTVNPVTINDFRKVMIDVPGVKNAWIRPSDAPEQRVYIDCKKSRLTTDKNAPGVKEAPLGGLYEISIEFEDDATLGDLNERCFGLAVNGFEVEVFMPGWDVFLSLSRPPVKIEFTDVKPVDKSRKYTAVFKAHIEGGDILERSVTIISAGEKTPENLTLIETEVNRTGTGCLSDRYISVAARALDIAKKVYKTLQSRRNLCEDFARLKGVEIEDIGVCAEIETTPEADLEDVLSEIWLKVAEFLSPAVRFYSLDELFKKGLRADEIFEGPALEHGFVLESELAGSAFRQAVHASDIINVIMSVDGVAAVKDLVLSSFYGCEPSNKGERWCLKVGADRLTRLAPAKSRFILYKGLIPYHANRDKARKLLKEKTARQGGGRLPAEPYDPPAPVGAARKIQSYHSIQNGFPLCYGVGEEGLPRSVSRDRKAKAKQLKAYLLFYDRLLADYFSQLAHMRDLFSLDPEIKRTYFTHPLYFDTRTARSRTSGTAPLLADFVDALGKAGVDLEKADIDAAIEANNDLWEQFKAKKALEYDDAKNSVDGLVEDVATFEDRKNRLLDHLMARFAEQFTDYVLLMYTMEHKRAPGELIEDKIAFLSDYPEISRNRFKALDYTSTPAWDTDNVSGLEKRVSRLLGMRSYGRRSLMDCALEAFEIEKKDVGGGAFEYRFKLRDEEGNIMLSAPKAYAKPEEAKKAIGDVLEFGVKKENYDPKTTEGGKFYFNLLNANGEVVARRITYFATQAERDAEIANTVEFIKKGVHECEGFHLVEHILLRPLKENDELLDICVEDGCGGCAGFSDPYSFRATAVVPYWPHRFRNQDFRQYFETVIRSEAPAHAHVKICWVTRKMMEDFEKAYRKWLEEKSAGAASSEALKALVLAMKSLRSVYPQARLYDCKHPGADTVLLNRSKLGTTEQEG